APAIELADIAGSEIAARRIKQLEVILVDLLRAFVIQRRLVVMVALEQLDHVETGDNLLAVGLQVFPMIRAAGLGAERQCAESQQECEGTAGNEVLHAGSTRELVITHIRPS